MRVEGRQDGSYNPCDNIRSGGANTLIFIVKKKNQRRQLLKHPLTGPFEYGRPPDGTTLAYKNFANVNVSLHDVGETCRGIHWRLFQWNLAGKHFRATEMFGAISDDVFVWELEGLEGPYRAL